MQPLTSGLPQRKHAAAAPLSFSGWRKFNLMSDWIQLLALAIVFQEEVTLTSICSSSAGRTGI